MSADDIQIEIPDESIDVYVPDDESVTVEIPESGDITVEIPEVDEGNPYMGDYEVIPSINFQLLPTAECHLEEDILVRPIPYAEVSNLSGGYTATIGG